MTRTSKESPIHIFVLNFSYFTKRSWSTTCSKMMNHWWCLYVCWMANVSMQSKLVYLPTSERISPFPISYFQKLDLFKYKVNISHWKLVSEACNDPSGPRCGRKSHLLTFRLDECDYPELFQSRKIDHGSDRRLLIFENPTTTALPQTLLVACTLSSPPCIHISVKKLNM